MKEKVPDLIHLIHSVQRIEGNPDCFGTANGYCDQKNCIWRDYCLKKPERQSAEIEHYPENNADDERLQTSQKHPG